MQRGTVAKGVFNTVIALKIRIAVALPCSAGEKFAALLSA
jgi:hypothetical protein